MTHGGTIIYGSRIHGFNVFPSFGPFMQVARRFFLPLKVRGLEIFSSLATLRSCNSDWEHRRNIAHLRYQISKPPPLLRKKTIPKTLLLLYFQYQERSAKNGEDGFKRIPTSYAFANGWKESGKTKCTNYLLTRLYAKYTKK